MSNMDPVMLDVVYKNTQRVRIKNQCEENALQRAIDGKRGYRAKLK